jgi:hypothetical protein
MLLIYVIGALTLAFHGDPHVTRYELLMAPLALVLIAFLAFCNTLLDRATSKLTRREARRRRVA